jgi:uncharacterized protein YjiS (DUF1127 family)
MAVDVPQILSGKVELPWRGAVVAVRRRLPRLLHTVWLWHERARQRRHLRSLSEHMLRDLGLSRCDVESEAAKPFWRA